MSMERRHTYLGKSPLLNPPRDPSKRSAHVVGQVPIRVSNPRVNVPMKKSRSNKEKGTINSVSSTSPSRFESFEMSEFSDSGEQT